MQSILSIMFTQEERETIRITGMRIWDRDHQNRQQNGEEKMPIQCPSPELMLSGSEGQTPGFREIPG